MHQIKMIPAFISVNPDNIVKIFHTSAAVTRNPSPPHAGGDARSRAIGDRIGQFFIGDERIGPVNAVTTVAGGDTTLKPACAALRIVILGTWFVVGRATIARAGANGARSITYLGLKSDANVGFPTYSTGSQARSQGLLGGIKSGSCCRG